MPRAQEITLQETSRDQAHSPMRYCGAKHGFSKTETAEPKHLKKDFPHHNFPKEKSAYTIRAFLLQIILLWKQNSNTLLITSTRAITMCDLIKETVSV